MDSLLTKGITYGALDRALLTLGFQEETYETHRLYKKNDQGAIIVLPRNIQMDQPAHAIHLLTARHTVTGMGIADEAEFENLLTAPHETKPSLPTRANGHAPRRSRSHKPRLPITTSVEAG